MLTEGEWFDILSKSSHYRKKGRKEGLGRKNGGMGKRGLSLSVPIKL